MAAQRHGDQRPAPPPCSRRPVAVGARVRCIVLLGATTQKALSVLGIETSISDKSRGGCQEKRQSSHHRRRGACWKCVVRLHEEHHLKEGRFVVESAQLAEKDIPVAWRRDPGDRTHLHFAAVERLMRRPGRHDEGLACRDHFLFVAYTCGKGA